MKTLLSRLFSKTLSVGLATAVICVTFALPTTSYATSDVCVDTTVTTIPATDIGSAIGTTVATGTTVGQVNDTMGSCAGTESEDVAFTWTAPANGEYTLDTIGSTFDTVLYLLDGTTSAALELTNACNDDAVNSQSSLTKTFTTGQTITIVIDGYTMGTSTSAGDFILNIAFTPAADNDADSFTNPGEDCDDTNSAIHPGTTDTDNDIDDDCDGIVDEDVDLDADGYSTPLGDCDDTNAAVNPDAFEIIDFIDNNCDDAVDNGMLEVTNSNTYTVPNDKCDTAERESSGTTIATLDISDSYTIVDVNVAVDITHTFAGDLTLFLISPDGKTMTLSTNNGTGGKNYTQTIFDDEANVAISTGAAPFTGSFQPNSLLSDIDGSLTAGTWTLQIDDVASADFGTLNSWSLYFTVAADQDQDGYIDAYLDGLDCNDTNAALNPGVTEIDDDIDNNCDGTVDEGFTQKTEPPVEEPITETPPTTEEPTTEVPPTTTEPTEETPTNTVDGNSGDESPDETEETNENEEDATLNSVAVTDVQPTKRGMIVTLSDGTSQTYNLFHKRKRKTALSVLNDHLVAVVQPNGKSLKLFNYVTGETLQSQQLADETYRHLAVKVETIQDNKFFILTAKDKTNGVRLSVVRLKLKKERFGAYSSARLEGGNIQIKKTKIKKSHILLKNADGDTVFSYKINSEFQLQAE
ncbi:MAG: proprotein convertase P-domain-containing protein [Candidatus Kerfeldbacteria bacterium]|nr:proprotein convertase P-domain-containing protein [Candidatus Kerfeldbacteria bacterium]